MRFEDYTKPQQEAIIAKGENIIVSAGAGSGKTQVLTQRVVHFIKNEGYHLNEFLILTFTNLAAGEMKERIRKELEKQGLDASKDVDLAEISTFDSYALKLVKKYHVLLNVSNDISIVDGSIISVRKRTMLNDILEEYYQGEDDDFNRMIKRFCFKDDSDILSLLLMLYDKKSKSDDDYLDNFVNRYYNLEYIYELVEYVSNKLKEKLRELLPLLNKLPNIPISTKDKRSYGDLVRLQLEKLYDAKEYDDYLKFLKFDIEIPKKPKNAKDDSIDEFEKKFSDLLDFASNLPPSKDAFIENYQNDISIANKLIEIVRKLDQRILEFKEKYQVFEFNDIAKMALKLVKENQEIKESIKNSLKMIMIDEYQDTSLIQENFINEIENNNVYMVGDVKQSIYRFRDAKSEIFTNKYNKYKEHNGGRVIDLNKNFRSRKEVLDDINYLFKQIMNDDCGGANYAKDHIIEFGNKSYAKNSYNNNAEFLIYDPRNHKNSVDVEARLIAQDIINKMNSRYQVFDGKQGLRDCKFSDFCILMDRGVEFEKYVKIFNEYQIPLYMVKDENITSNDCVTILTNLLKLIKYIFDDDFNSTGFIHTFVSIARSFIYEYGDDKIYEICCNKAFYNDPIIKDIKDIINKNSHLSISDLFEEILFSLNFYYRIIRLGNVIKNEQYIDQFLSMIKQMVGLDYTIDDLIIFMSYVNEYNIKLTLPSVGSELDNVQIMTIHKSKGLEFNIVYYSGLTANFNREEIKAKMSLCDYGLVLHNEYLNVIKMINEDHEVLEDTSEKIRLFYVALTRAREKMIFLYPTDVSEYFLVENYKTYNKYYGYDISTIINSFKNNEFNKEVFRMLISDYDINLSSKFYRLSIDEIREFSEEEIMNYQVHLDYNAYIDNTYLPVALRNLYNDYMDNILSLNELIEILFIFGKTIKPSYLKKYKDRNLKEYKESHFIDHYSSLCNFKINPIIVNGKALDHLIELISNEKISKNEAERFLEILGVSFKEDIFTIDTSKTKDYCRSIKSNENISLDEFYNRINKIEMDKALLMYYIYHGKYPFADRFNELHKHILNKKISKECFKMFIDVSGIELSGYAKKAYDCLFDGEFMNFDIPYVQKYSFKNALGDEKIMSKVIIDDITKLYDDQKINFSEYQEMLLCLNYELDIDDPNIVIDCGSSHDLSSKTNFKEFIDIVYDKYDKYSYDLSLENKLQISDEEVLERKLIINEIAIESKEIKHLRASKGIDLNASRAGIDFGNELHLLLEVIDFKNPDYSSIKNNFYKDLVKSFLGSPLMKNIMNADIYKEYEFFDENSLVKGIIDLMLIYDDHIDIIDYKTKNIDDEAYVKQLNEYKNHIVNVFGKNVNCYLYSILLKDYKQI